MNGGSHPALRVVLDARPALDPRRTGVGHYAWQLVHHLPPVDPDTSYVAWYLHARGLLHPRSFFAGVSPNLSEKASRLPARIFQPVSWRIELPRVEWLTGPFDLLLATNFLPPATARLDRCVLVVHDLAFERFPETAPHHDARWRRRFKRALQECAAVIVPSASTRDDLVTMSPVRPERVHVVHHGVDASAFSPRDRDAVRAARARFGVPEGDYILFLGGLEPRKNLSRLVKAFAQLEGPWSLVIAGGWVRWDPRAAGGLEAEVAALPPAARSRVIRTGYVSDDDRHALLSGASVLAYPSLYEGFGFPVLEGFAAGVPVVTSNASSLPEVAGDAAILVDPKDPSEIAEGLRRVLSDPDLGALLRAAGLARVAGFTWEATARATTGVVHSAAGVAG